MKRRDEFMLVKKEDKRVIKTKRDLRNALASLLKKSSYSKITVCDICEEAQINRMTFYKHYMDKMDLLNDVFNFDRVFVSDIEKLKGSEANCQDLVDCVLPVVKQLTAECVDKQEIIKAMYSDDNDIIGDIVFNAIHNIGQQILGVYFIKHKCKYDAELILDFLSGGLTKVLLSYVSTKQNYPKDKLISEMVAVFETIVKSNMFEQD
jgi:AcrR family transcriptional regulator